MALQERGNVDTRSQRGQTSRRARTLMLNGGETMSKKWALWAGAAIGAAAMLPSAAHAQAKAGGPFQDVPQQHWAYDAVQSLAQKGIFTGYPDGTFSGRRALTRYEFAVALQRMLQQVPRQVAAIQLKPGPQGDPGA